MLSIPESVLKAVEDEEAASKAGAEPKAGKKAKAPKEEDTAFGMVLYTDGSAQPTNPGYGGWGLHGYIYSHLPPTKGHGNSTQHLTADGYSERSTYAKMNGGAKPAEVKPIQYVNGFGSFADQVTNNVAEAAGVANGLAYANERGVRKVLIKCDSKYAVQGSTEWLPIWKRNNWIKGDGTLVANRGIWETLDKNLQALTDKGCDVEVRWVKGHSVHLGNQLADKNADYGALYSKRGEVRTEFTTAAAEGFWSAKVEKHPFICQRRIYFSSVGVSNVPGEYYLGEHGKDDELLGKRTADGAHSFIKLKEPETLIELMRRYQCEIAGGQDSIMMGRLDKLYEAGVVNDLEAYGNICFVRPHRHRLDLNFVDGEPISKECKPPRLTMRAIQSLNTIKGVFESWQAGTDENLTATDVTDKFYETTDKGECRLKAEFVVGFSSLPITASYGKTNAKKEDKIDLCLGVDLPDRNALKKLEKFKPRVIVVTWMEADQAFRYATIVQAGDDFGIWAGMHSNLRVVV